jgi:hypothetical protein
VIKRRRTPGYATCSQQSIPNWRQHSSWWWWFWFNYSITKLRPQVKWKLVMRVKFWRIYTTASKQSYFLCEQMKWHYELCYKLQQSPQVTINNFSAPRCYHRFVSMGKGADSFALYCSLEYLNNFTSVTGWVYVELLILEPRCYTQKIMDEAWNCTAQDCHVPSGHSTARGTHG